MSTYSGCSLAFTAVRTGGGVRGTAEWGRKSDFGAAGFRDGPRARSVGASVGKFIFTVGRHFLIELGMRVAFSAAYYNNSSSCPLSLPLSLFLSHLLAVLRRSRCRARNFSPDNTQNRVFAGGFWQIIFLFRRETNGDRATQDEAGVGGGDENAGNAKAVR